jgi:hypothetical protein
MAASLFALYRLCLQHIMSVATPCFKSLFDTILCRNYSGLIAICTGSLIQCLQYQKACELLQAGGEESRKEKSE